MRLRDWLIGVLAAGLLVAVLLSGLLAWQLRLFYEDQLVREVWPTGLVEPTIVAASNGGITPTTLLLGDSRMAQWSLPRPQGGHIVNAGLPGATTARITAAAGKFVERYRPDIVVVQAGINDIKLVGLRPDLRPQVVAEAAANLTRLAEICRSFGSRVIVLLVWPAGEPELLRRPIWNASAVSDAVTELNMRLRALHAPEKGIVVFDLLTEAGVRPAYRDALHLTSETYRRMAPILDRKIQELRSMP